MSADDQPVRKDMCDEKMAAMLGGVESLRQSVDVVNQTLKENMLLVATDQRALTTRVNRMIGAVVVQLAVLVVALLVYIFKAAGAN